MGCTNGNPPKTPFKGEKLKIFRQGSKLKRPFSLQDLVNDYLNQGGYFGSKKTIKEQHEDYLNSLTDMTDWICGKPNEKKIPAKPPYQVDVHQRYLRVEQNQPLIIIAGQKLEGIENKKFKNFEELYKFIRDCKVKGFGPTTWYDFSLRFGWHQTPRIQPKEFVYIHSKPGLAATTLKDKGYITVPISNPLKRSDFPDEIKNSKMDAADIEHFLCVYKKLIEELPINK